LHFEEMAKLLEIGNQNPFIKFGCKYNKPYKDGYNQGVVKTFQG